MSATVNGTLDKYPPLIGLTNRCPAFAKMLKTNKDEILSNIPWIAGLAEHALLCGGLVAVGSLAIRSVPIALFPPVAVGVGLGAAGYVVTQLIRHKYLGDYKGFITPLYLNACSILQKKWQLIEG